jgi:hypothetical protein
MKISGMVQNVYGLCQECDIRNIELPVCTVKAEFVGFVQVREMMMYIMDTQLCWKN